MATAALLGGFSLARALSTRTMIRMSPPAGLDKDARIGFRAVLTVPVRWCWKSNEACQGAVRHLCRADGLA